MTNDKVGPLYLDKTVKVRQLMVNLDLPHNGTSRLFVNDLLLRVVGPLCGISV